MSRLFRLRYGWKEGGTSSSEWVYRESFESMVEELEFLLLQLDIHKAKGRKWYGRELALRIFHPRGREKMPGDSWHVTKIHSVEEFIDEEWVDLEFEWVPPLLAVKGPSS